jgi:hypothetical protein
VLPTAVEDICTSHCGGWFCTSNYNVGIGSSNCDIGK